MNKRGIGTRFEQLAARYLEERGYRILETNYRCRKGEIDIVARDGIYLVFCEVKYRTDEEAGDPMEAVGGRKQARIIHTARYYLLSHGLPEETPCRFDVVGIAKGHMTLMKNAFES
ncbi:MAG: YraN family protein [Lachnospiraceae bacterium]|nr:YraN family protein [Lachnospiraceae bacterium]